MECSRTTQIALHFVQDKNTRFDLAVECGNLDVALETARAIDRPECWDRLAQQALKQGNHKVCFFSFLLLIYPLIYYHSDRRKGLPANQKLRPPFVFVPRYGQYRKAF